MEYVRLLILPLEHIVMILEIVQQVNIAIEQNLFAGFQRKLERVVCQKISALMVQCVFRIKSQDFKLVMDLLVFQMGNE